MKTETPKYNLQPFSRNDFEKCLTGFDNDKSVILDLRNFDKVEDARNAAAFIVQACNAHTGLVEIAEYMRDVFYDHDYSGHREISEKANQLLLTLK